MFHLFLVLYVYFTKHTDISQAIIINLRCVCAQDRGHITKEWLSLHVSDT